MNRNYTMAAGVVAGIAASMLLRRRRAISLRSFPSRAEMAIFAPRLANSFASSNPSPR